MEALYMEQVPPYPREQLRTVEMRQIVTSDPELQSMFCQTSRFYSTRLLRKSLLDTETPRNGDRGGYYVPPCRLTSMGPIFSGSMAGRVRVAVRPCSVPWHTISLYAIISMPKIWLTFWRGDQLTPEDECGSNASQHAGQRRIFIDSGRPFPNGTS